MTAREISREDSVKPTRAAQRGVSEAELDAMKSLFGEFDQDGNGTICFEEFTSAMQRLNVQPHFLEEGGGDAEE